MKNYLKNLFIHIFILLILSAPLMLITPESAQAATCFTPNILGDDTKATLLFNTRTKYAGLVEMITELFTAPKMPDSIFDWLHDSGELYYWDRASGGEIIGTIKAYMQTAPKWLLGLAAEGLVYIGSGANENSYWVNWVDKINQATLDNVTVSSAMLPNDEGKQLLSQIDATISSFFSSNGLIDQLKQNFPNNEPFNDTVDKLKKGTIQYSDLGTGSNPTAVNLGQSPSFIPQYYYDPAKNYFIFDIFQQCLVDNGSFDQNYMHDYITGATNINTASDLETKLNKVKSIYEAGASSYSDPGEQASGQCMGKEGLNIGGGDINIIGFMACLINEVANGIIALAIEWMQIFAGI